MFDINHPAENIHVLINYLEKIHSDDYVYRGQEKDFDSLIPSFYRNKLAKFRYDKASGKIISQFNKYNHFIKYDASKDSERNIAKRITMNHLMGNLGKSLGNVIAQQYGVSSECLDVTSDINVAAFFATHKWPHYDFVINTSELGVIYRIPCMRHNNAIRHIQHAGTELSLSAVYLSKDTRPIPLLYSSFKHQHTIDEYNELNKKYRFTSQHTISQPIVCDNSDFKNIIITYFAEKYPTLNIEVLYSNTRMERQKAGFIIPSFVFDSNVPSNLEVTNIQNIETYSPSFVIHNEKVVIEDILTYPGIEKYYFRHDSSVVSKYSREYLWPAKESDYFYDLLYRWCSDGCRNYLNKLHIEIDDMNNGIIDKGFY